MDWVYLHVGKKRVNEYVEKIDFIWVKYEDFWDKSKFILKKIFKFVLSEFNLQQRLIRKQVNDNLIVGEFLDNYNKDSLFFGEEVGKESGVIVGKEKIKCNEDNVIIEEEDKSNVTTEVEVLKTLLQNKKLNLMKIMW